MGGTTVVPAPAAFMKQPSAWAFAAVTVLEFLAQDGLEA